ncbi:MAG: hypothetical protein WKF84_16855 [Pyrinomonadaceae bacterium]
MQRCTFIGWVCGGGETSSSCLGQQEPTKQSAVTTTTDKSQTTTTTTTTGAQKDEPVVKADGSVPPVTDSRSAARDVTEAGNSVETNRALQQQQMSEEEAAVLPYYNNFMATYRIGPEDVISVSVLGLERYSKPNITVLSQRENLIPAYSNGSDGCRQNYRRTAR